MTLPHQAAPVMRVNASAFRPSHGAVLPQDCGLGDKIACGVLIVGCAAACIITGSAACISCLGPAYNQCKKCF